MGYAAQGFLCARQANQRLFWPNKRFLHSTGPTKSGSVGLIVKIPWHAGLKTARLWTDTN
jgi:hypothetical protein